MVISREFRLLLACCRSAFQRVNTSNLIESRDPVDWSLFLRLARFHRVQALVWHVIRSEDLDAPVAVEQELKSDSTEIAVSNLRSALECRDLVSAFNEARIPLLFVKGLTLGALAYGDISLKSGVDIDLLVAPNDLADAAAILQRAGYRLSEPKIDWQIDFQRLESWHSARKESVWVDRRRMFQIDLHTRLSDNQRLIPSIGPGSPHDIVEVAPRILLPTLRTDELFAYLGVHGASSAWFRLKWITDFAALCERCGPQEVERLYRSAQKLCGGRTAAQALLLADSLYGTLRHLSSLREELETDWGNRWLFKAALKQLGGGREPIEPTGHLFGTWRIHLTQLPLMPGLRFPASELRRQLQHL